MNTIRCRLCGALLQVEHGQQSICCDRCMTVNSVPPMQAQENGMQSDQPYIFASYAHKDNDTVLPILHAMQKDGFRVWYDSGIEVGTEWPAYIEKMVLGCTVFIVFLSDNAIESANCRKEINLAAECGKKVLVLQMDEQIDYKEYGMRLQLNTYQKLYVCRFAERKKLLAALHEASILHSCKTVGVPEPTAEPIAPVQQDSDRVKALVKRAFLFLEDGEREKADAYCEQALDLDPEYAPAYVVKTMLALGYTDIRDFENKCTEKLATHPAFSKALRFADDLYRTTLRHMVKQADYNRAIALMQKGDMMSLCEAIVEFQSLEDTYADAADLRAQCQQKLDALTEQAERSSAQQGTTNTLSEKKRFLADSHHIFNRIIACSDNYTVALRVRYGTVLADGEKDSVINEAQKWQNITAVSCGYSHIVGLRADGTVCNTARGSWGDVCTKKWKNIVSIACTFSGTVGLKKNGTVVYCGHEKNLRQAVKNWTEITEIAANIDHIVGLTKDGRVLTAGKKASMPQCNTADWKNIIAIAAGDNFTAGWQADGKVIAVGKLPGICEGMDSVVLPWTDIVAVAAGKYHIVGLKADGTVVATEKDLHSRSYTQNWTHIITVVCNSYITVGVKVDGTVVATGRNYHGRCDVSDWKLF